MARRSPARRRKAPASVGQHQPHGATQLSAERKRQIKADACRQVLAEMQAEIAKALAEDQAAWQAATGRPMPMNLDELVIEARVAGMNDDDLDNPSPLKNGYRGTLTEATVRKIHRDERIADEVAAQVAVAERLAPPSEPTVSEAIRIANALSTKSRKALAALDEWGANSLGNKMTREDIEDRTHLSRSSVRNVMERELLRQGVALVATKTGPSGGVWLTPEGAAVASTIDKKILPREDNSAAGKKH
jgi:hypothetical protein